jgi:hypothetical protein
MGGYEQTYSLLSNFEQHSSTNILTNMKSSKLKNSKKTPSNDHFNILQDDSSTAHSVLSKVSTMPPARGP